MRLTKYCLSRNEKYLRKTKTEAINMGDNFLVAKLFNLKMEI